MVSNDCLSSLFSALILTVSVISLMGRCYRVQGWLTESEEYHRRAVKVITDLFGDHHRSTAHG